MKLIKQAFKFFGISGIGWLIDFLIYTILTSVFKINVYVSNMISSLVGVSFVFFVSTRKLFINHSKINLKIKYLIYVIYQVILIFTVSKIMLMLKNVFLDFNFNLIKNYLDLIVKIIITPFTMIINFIVMKKLIEKL